MNLAPLDEAVMLQAKLNKLSAQSAALRERRNAAITRAIEGADSGGAEPVSMYRVAKALGISEEAVAKIRRQ